MTILDITRNGSSSYAVHFSAPCTFNYGNPGDGTLLIGGLLPVTMQSIDATHAQWNAASVAAGLTWSLTGQPPWLISPPVTFPASGMTA